MSRTQPVVEVIDDQMAEIYRGMTEQERLQIAFGMWRSGQRMIGSILRTQNPDWSETELQAEVARRMSDGTG